MELLAWDPAKAAASFAWADARARAVAAHLRPGLEVRLAAHAPHSVSPELLRLLAERGGPAAIHVAESHDESAFLLDGSGPWPAFLAGRGLAGVVFEPPGVSPVRHLEEHGALHSRLVAAHCVQLDAADRELLARRGVHVVLCPRSNRNLGVGIADVPALLAAGVRLALGTDSLASVDTLDVLEEAVLLHRQFPALDPAGIVRMATTDGAAALGFDDLGTLAPGKRAALAFAAAESVPRRRSRVPPLGPGAADDGGGMSSRALDPVLAYGRMIRFSHSVFALPFALSSAALAARAGGVTVSRIAWIVVAMVAARSAAMGFNRLVDRAIDARNPRTAGRELPRGVLSPAAVTLFVVVSAAVFVLAAAMLNPLCLALSPVALAITFGYSYTKRFTAASHAVLGLSLAIAPVGAWLAIRGRFDVAPLVLAAAVMLWVAGFDAIYACQDVEFDRSAGLHSIPSRLGAARTLVLARLLHVAALVLMATLFVLVPLHVVYLAGVAVIGALLAWEHTLVEATDLSRVMQAFNLNGWVSLAYFAFTALAAWLA